MKYLFYFVLLLFSASIMTSCAEDNDDVLEPATASEINDFIWKGLNGFYLYKSQVPDLADDRFSSNEGYADFLNTFTTPEAIFEGLLTTQTTFVNGDTYNVDDFSFLVDDYVALEESFDGLSLSNGMEFSLFFADETETAIFGVVRYVLPNTDAKDKGIQRGDAFNSVNGNQLTVDNYRDLLFGASTTYSIGLANYDGENVTSTGQSIELTQVEYTENPVFITKTLDIGDDTVGYLMYNSFTADFDTELNNAFGELKAAGITELVLDLRYNGGGSVTSAVALASMISAQSTDNVFSVEEWNSDINPLFNDEDLINSFVTTTRDNDAINSVNLDRLYVLTTNSSASASELVINGLDPYIDVVTVGTATRGKFQASITLYDSDNFFRSGDNLNTGHTYAMQPLVLKSSNSLGVTDYYAGFAPDIEVFEDRSNLGILGDPEETLLKAALDDIQGAARSFNKSKTSALKLFGESKMNSPIFQRMYLDLENAKK
ncbi:S41 family peptidase [Aquimarina pacifica]|uniref:S41 family peptidase n=1 Tax=Aquimarina pacifica TaxID=1296415 RepID=UPI00046FEEF7|nr:S41 family peptidase [Aquimarina pacifica]